MAMLLLVFCFIFISIAGKKFNYNSNLIKFKWFGVSLESQKQCVNGGVSTRFGGVDLCVCPKDYFGDLCEIGIGKLSQNEKDRFGCSLKPCWFGSTCEDLTHLNGTFRCHCNAVR